MGKLLGAILELILNLKRLTWKDYNDNVYIGTALFIIIVVSLIVYSIRTSAIKKIHKDLERIAEAQEALNRWSGVYDGEENPDPRLSIDMTKMQPGETWQQFKERTGRQ